MLALRRRKLFRLVGWFGVALLWTTLPATTSAQVPSIPPGFDLFETDPQTTAFELQVPAGFFAPGSDPFAGHVKFAGVPLETFDGKAIGDADTVVRRTAPADPAPIATVPIEIVALSLVSMEPITITYNGGQTPEPWDVGAGLSPTRPSLGQMTIHKTQAQGGTFDSQLEVVPLLTFTRLTDGQTRTFDGAILPPSALTLFANGVPWRSGCEPPALAVPGLNDAFCPGFTPEGQKQLTIEDALLADHGIYPAQPAAEHFKCYRLQRSRFKDRGVTLTDQFGAQATKVTGRKELCNPARKSNEPLLNKRAHLVCYSEAGADPQKLVVVRNQFGSQRLLVRGAKRLCVPSQKREVGKRFKPIRDQIDHLQCYDVEPEGPLQRFGQLGQVKLEDQFGREKVKIGDPVQLCAPVVKQIQNDITQVQHPVHHLVCYAIRDAPKQVRVEIRNQFEKRYVVTRSPNLLCVPSAKVVVPVP